MHARQPEVENQQVELGVGEQCRVGFGAAGHVVGRRARSAKCAQQAIGQNLIVFGYQNSHGCLQKPAAAVRRWREASRFKF